MESHFTVYFTEIQGNQFNINYFIDNVTVDVVYGDYTPASCNENVRLTRKTSV